MPSFPSGWRRSDHAYPAEGRASQAARGDCRPLRALRPHRRAGLGRDPLRPGRFAVRHPPGRSHPRQHSQIRRLPPTRAHPVVPLRSGQQGPGHRPRGPRPAQGPGRSRLLRPDRPPVLRPLLPGPGVRRRGLPRPSPEDVHRGQYLRPALRPVLLRLHGQRTLRPRGLRREPDRDRGRVPVRSGQRQGLELAAELGLRPAGEGRSATSRRPSTARSGFSTARPSRTKPGSPGP